MRAVSFRQPALAGIAIQPENLHLVQLKKSRKSYVIERVRRYPLPAEIFSGGRIARFTALEDQLKQVVQQEGLHAAKTVVCMPANQVRMQRMIMPAGLSETDIEAEISAQVYRSLPSKSSALAIDFRIAAASNAAEVDVFFAAARKDDVQRYQSCLSAAGLRIIMMDVDVFALLRAVRFSLQHVLSPHEKLCALYLGHNYAVIAAQQGNEILFYQQWDGSGAASQTMTRSQWIEWCCRTYQQMEVTSVAIGGMPELVYEAAAMIGSEWDCRVFEPDPFLQMLGASGIDKAVIHDSPSAFLLACGLAMREVTPW